MLHPWAKKDGLRSTVGDEGGGEVVRKRDVNQEVCGDLAIVGDVGPADCGGAGDSDSDCDRPDPRARRFPRARHAADEQ